MANKKTQTVKLTLTKAEVKSLKKMLEYMNDSEADHFEEHLENEGEAKDHIYHHVQIVEKAVKGKI